MQVHVVERRQSALLVLDICTVLFSTDALMSVVLCPWLVCLIGSKLSMLLKDRMNGVRDHTRRALRGSAITSHPSFRTEIKGRAKRRCLLGI